MFSGTINRNAVKSEYKCPLCGSGIAMDDINVAADIALCRACGKTSPFSVIAGGAAISPDILSNPPGSVRVSQDFREGTTIIYRKLSGALFFLIPFTAFWSGLSMWGIYGTQFKKGEFDLSQSLFGLPFLIGTIVLLSIIMFLFFGKWKITMRKGFGTIFMGVGSFGWTRYFNYDRDTLVSMRMTNTRVNNVPQQGILIKNGDNELVFGTLIKADAKQYIAATIMKQTRQEQ